MLHIRTPARTRLIFPGGMLALILSMSVPSLAAAGRVEGGAGAAAIDHLAETLQPDPALGPAEVVRIQLEALRGNDAADRGIEVAFRFASPQNRQVTGPMPRFARMIKEGPYAVMLNFTHASYDELEVLGRHARQVVTLIAPGSAPMTFRFHLSRQDGEGTEKDCWMTEGVQLLPAAGLAA